MMLRCHGAKSIRSHSPRSYTHLQSGCCKGTGKTYPPHSLLTASILGEPPMHASSCRHHQTTSQRDCGFTCRGVRALTSARRSAPHSPPQGPTRPASHCTTVTWLHQTGEQVYCLVRYLFCKAKLASRRCTHLSHSIHDASALSSSSAARTACIRFANTRRV